MPVMMLVCPCEWRGEMLKAASEKVVTVASDTLFEGEMNTISARKSFISFKAEFESIRSPTVNYGVFCCM